MEKPSKQSQEKKLDFESRVNLTNLKKAIDEIRSELKKVLVGQDKIIDFLIAGLIANGHILIEGVPGIAKTLAVKLLAEIVNAKYSRIQFTPDLMPSDVLGTSIFNAKTNDFEFKFGPVFANLVLVDEINRAPSKTQSALFESMEEKQITIDGITYQLDLPFLVFATQNPIEQEGTYRLPEAQLDRFLFKVEMTYPNEKEEVEIIQRHHEWKEKKKIALVNKVIDKEQIISFQVLTKNIVVEPQLISFISKIVVATRQNPMIYLGASPRASIAILNASKAFAVMAGRDFITPEDIKTVAVPALIHRIIVMPEREMEGITSKQVIEQIIQSIEIPR